MGNVCICEGAEEGIKTEASGAAPATPSVGASAALSEDIAGEIAEAVENDIHTSIVECDYDLPPDPDEEIALALHVFGVPATDARRVEVITREGTESKPLETDLWSEQPEEWDANVEKAESQSHSKTDETSLAQNDNLSPADALAAMSAAVEEDSITRAAGQEESVLVSKSEEVNKQAGAEEMESKEAAVPETTDAKPIKQMTKSKAKAKAKKRAEIGTESKALGQAPSHASAAKSAEVAKPKKAAFPTAADAKNFLEYSFGVIEQPATKKSLLGEIKKIRSGCQDDMEFQLEAMVVLPPIMWRLIGSEMEKYGYKESNMMVGLMHINKYAEGDKKIKKQLTKLQAYLEGTVG